MDRARLKEWFFRFTAAHFVLTSLTGVLLYFRPGGSRPGLYSDQVKEWIVMIHNGEWISFALFGQPFVSGILMGLVLAGMLIRFSSQRFTRRRAPALEGASS
jgi:hypothetical protein